MSHWERIGGTASHCLFPIDQIDLNTRTGKGGGADSALPHVFCEYLSKYSFDRRDIFNTCPKINGAPFGAKIEDASILGVYF